MFREILSRLALFSAIFIFDPSLYLSGTGILGYLGGGGSGIVDGTSLYYYYYYYHYY